MQEKDLIKKLKGLKEIKPDENWALSVKKEVLGVDNELKNKVEWIEVLRFFKGRRLAYATLTALFVLVGVFGFAQNSLPGDRLYTVKRTTEQLQTFVRMEEPLSLSFKLANRRLEELNTAVERSYSQNINPAVEEFQTSVSEISRNVNVGEIEDIKFVEKEITEMEEKVNELETLGVRVDKEDLDTFKANVENERICRDANQLITLQEDSTLTTEKEQILEEAKNSLVEGNCERSKEIMLVDFESAGENQFEIAEENNEDN